MVALARFVYEVQGLQNAVKEAAASLLALASLTMGFTPERLLPFFFSKRGWWK